MRFSEQTQAFYDDNYEENALVDDLPSDVKKITDEQYQQFYLAVNDSKYVYYSGNDFKISVAKPDTYYLWDNTTSSWTLTDEAKQKQKADQVTAAEQQKQQLISTAMQSISVIQLKLQAGRTLTDAEKARLNAVLDYIDEVTAVDTSAAPDISWPVLSS